jgi:membrane-bound lytic murein transglycosylase D
MLSALLAPTQVICAQPPNVWAVMRKQFTLNHELNRPEVQNQLRWLIAHPSYVNELADSKPYIYHIVNEIKKRHLPGELAIIPMIESSFDPFAYSGAGAAGLWQLMPGTGTDLGLKQDWWFDGRRSIGHSTDAALNYLTYLHKFFHGNWILAIAAYDSGEGTMARIIKKSGQSRDHVSFWSLPVPNETKAYIPRLLALAEIIQNPERYHVSLPNIPHTPYFEEVNIGSQIDLSNAAKLAGISYTELIKLNPGYNHWTTAPYRPYKLLIPADKVDDFSRNLANLPMDERVSWPRHQVSAGDNLQLIARKYNTSVNLIKELNQLKSNTVQRGQVVLIPNKKQTAKKNTPPKSSTYKVIHIVQQHDSYTTIAQKYDVSVQQIRNWNHLSINKALHKGQALVIWKTATKKP